MSSTKMPLTSQVQNYNNLIGNNNPSLISNYFNLQSKNPANYQQTNTSGVKNIVIATNNRLAELTLYANQLYALNNLNNESIIKKDQLIKLENDDLTQQLFKLENLQSTISNKNRMIEQINSDTQDTDNNIKTLMTVIILTLIFLLLIIAHGYKKIDDLVLAFLFGLIVFSFLITYMYLNNVFSFKDAIKNTVTNNDKKIIAAVAAVANTLKEETSDEIKKLRKNYIKNYCGCNPYEEVITEEETIHTKKTTTTGDKGSAGSPGSPGSDTYQETHYDLPYNSVGVSPANQLYVSPENTPFQPGYFYYDGSSPQQLLTPNPEIYSQNKNKKLPVIDWLDYSGNGNIKFNPNDTTQNYDISYDNAQSYNSSVKTDPNVTKKKLLNDADSYLLNNKTLTANQ